MMDNAQGKNVFPGEQDCIALRQRDALARPITGGDLHITPGMLDWCRQPDMNKGVTANTFPRFGAGIVHRGNRCVSKRHTIQKTEKVRPGNRVQSFRLDISIMQFQPVFQCILCSITIVNAERFGTKGCRRRRKGRNGC